MTLSQLCILKEESFLYCVIKIWLKKNSFWDAFEQATKFDPLPEAKATERDIWL